jgi:hypothetical protein
MPNATGDEIKKQALLLARENKKAEPGIESIYWIPSTTEVRLIEVESDTVKCLSGAVEPFYFDPAPADGLPAPSGVALIRPDEFGKLALPANWGSWEDAELLEVEG